jgi:hypothetical protein
MNRSILYLLLISFPSLYAAIPSQNQETLKKIVQKNLKEVPALPASTESTKEVRQTRKERKWIPIDRVEAVIFGREATHVVTFSDVNRLGFDGKQRTKEDVITEILMFEDALVHHVPMDEKTIDDGINKIAKSMNGTMDDVKLMFEQGGYTYEDGRRQFGIMQAANQMMEMKIRMALIIPEKEVQTYYDEHPEVIPAVYTIEKTSIPTARCTKEQAEKFSKTGKGLDLKWFRLPEIEESALAENKKFITRLKVDEISKPQQTDDSYEFFRIYAKRDATLIPLEKRYREIVETLRRPKFEKLLKEYKDSLLKSASVLYF